MGVGGEVPQSEVFLLVAVVFHFVDEHLFSSDLMIAFVYAIIILNSEHAHNNYTRGEGREVDGDN